jgi:hypothetical protein
MRGFKTNKYAKKKDASASYGLSAELKAKQDAKYDHELEDMIVAWMEDSLGKKKPDGKSFHDWLKTGVQLCRLANRLKPHAVKKISKSKMPFNQMDNISNFLSVCRKKFKIAEHSCFSTVDLFEAKNLGAVLTTLDALRKGKGGRKEKVKNLKDRMGGVGGFDISNNKIASEKRFDAVTGGADAVTGKLERNTTISAVRRASMASGARVKSKYADKDSGYDGSFGFSGEVRAKMDAKYDYELEEVIQEWIEDVTGKAFTKAFADELHSGIVLCNLMNALPGKHKKIPKSKMSKSKQKFSQMGNINFFIKAARQFGLTEHSVFSTVDLHEQKNMMAVLVTLDSIRRGCGGRKMAIKKQQMASQYDPSIRVQKGSTRADKINKNVGYTS